MTSPVDQEAANRSLLLGEAYALWVLLNPDPLADPDDDPRFVAKARKIMGLPPLESAA